MGDTVTESVPVANDDTIGTGSATVKIGTNAPTTATVKEIEKIDPVVISDILIDDISEVGETGSAGGVPCSRPR